MHFNPSRLALARKRRGLSRTSLASKSGVSIRSQRYYESEQVAPSSEAVRALAETLRFPIAFFYGPDIDEIACDAASFRSLSTMTASRRNASLAAGSIALALSKWIDERFQLPTPSVPDLRNFDPETAAQALRVEWGLGDRPIRNIVHLLEVHGVRVFSLPTDSASVDAFSVRHEGIPFVFLSPMKSAERWRMDAAHELGHLSLHGHGIPRSRTAELEADIFAGAFLMPRTDVLTYIPASVSLKKIDAMKKRWGVAAIALVHRLKTLGKITEWQYRVFCIEISKRGGRRGEQNGSVQRDMSQVFLKVLGTLRNEGVTRGMIARDLMITPTELDCLLRGLTITSVPDVKPGRSLAWEPGHQTIRQSTLRLAQADSLDDQHKELDNA